MLHTNELPLRHLFQHYDGKTTGTKTFSGAIGTVLINCESLPIVEFQLINEGYNLIDLGEEQLDDISTDQKYLHRIVFTIM